MILYELSDDSLGSSQSSKVSSEVRKSWVYVDSRSAHTHDVRALTVAVPISQQGLFLCFTSLHPCS